MMQQIINRLREAGVAAYMPAAHEGICTSPYCVVQHCSSVLSTPKGGYVRYRVYLYVPVTAPGELDGFAESVRDALRPMESEGLLRLAEPRGIVAADDTFRAVFSSIDYVSYYSER